MTTSPKKFRIWARQRENDPPRMYDTADHDCPHISVDGNAHAFSCQADTGWGQGGGDSVRWHMAIVIQYTGVDDNNGVPLYETDVVETEMGRAQIGFQHGFFCLNWLEVGGSFSHCNVELLGSTWKGRKREKLVRLGNGYENPALLTA